MCTHLRTGCSHATPSTLQQIAVDIVYHVASAIVQDAASEEGQGKRANGMIFPELRSIPDRISGIASERLALNFVRRFSIV